MIIPDDKRRISTIIASRKSAKGVSLGSAPVKPEVVKEASGEIDGRHVAAEEILIAIAEKSAAQLMNALANFHDLHSSRSLAADSEEYMHRDED